MRIRFYVCVQDDDNVAKQDDIIRVDWDKWSDGVPAANLTAEHAYCPFREANQYGTVMLEITEDDANQRLHKQRTSNEKR